MDNNLPPAETTVDITPQPPVGPAKPNNSKILLTSLIVLEVLTLSVAGYFGYQFMQLKKQIAYNVASPTPTAVTQSPTPTEPVATDETTSWKTYVNSQASFSFKYPADVFVYQGNPQQEAQFWSNKINGGAPLELGQDGIWLNVSFSNPGDTMTDFYNKIINLKINESIAQSAVTKLGDIKSGDVIGATYHQGVPPNFAGEAAYTYEAVWIKGGVVYRLSLSAFSEQNLQKYKTTFDQIILTFKFNQ